MISHRKLLRYGTMSFLSLATIVLTLFALLHSQHTAHADTFGWTSGTLSGQTPSYLSSNPDSYGNYGHCDYQTVLIPSQYGLSSVSACVFHAKSFRYAIISGMLYISVGDDVHFYPIINIGFGSIANMHPAPNSDNFAYGSVAWHNLLSHITLNTQSGSAHYEPVDGFDILSLDDQNNDHTIRNGGSVSYNGQWEIVNVENLGLVLVNLTTMAMTWLAPYFSGNEFTTISNDGRYVATVSFNDSHTPIVYDISDCGQNASKLRSSWFSSSLANPCASRDLGSTINSILGTGWFTSGARPDFSDDGGQLTLYVTPNGTGTGKGIVLNAAGYTPAAQLDYLGMGDSYSSGEGDTEVTSVSKEHSLVYNYLTGFNDVQFSYKHYRSYTDNSENKSAGVPREKCHVSTRSYPYLLASSMHLANNKWDSVACSGALTTDMKESNQYLGQDKGDDSKQARLDGYSNYHELQATALNAFIPGRVEQLKFVEKYKPKVITLTMGGNDVGFAKKLTDCIIWLTTCDIATESGRAGLAREINDQYDNLKSIYEKLYAASAGKTKIYVLGYPQFVNGDPNSICTDQNLGALNPNEREMIINSVTYMSKVIQQAAKAVGVKYIDIENSLAGHRLCDGDTKFVTGVTNIFGLNGNELQESFHPNAKGQNSIAAAVRSQVSSQSLLDYDICSDATNLCPDTSATKESIDVPSYFNGYESTTKVAYRQLTADSIVKNVVNTVITPTYLLSPSSSAQVIIHSNPVDLGEYIVAADGSLNADIIIPSFVPAGYHTLTVEGKTYSGEPIEYEQTVLVEGASQTDIDENNVPDSQQSCGPFMSAANVDADMDGIDDACDPEIAASPQLYRVRQGDPDRTYGGQAEKDYYLYVERNTHASSVIGVTGDYDPDGDGWAIVGTSKGVQYTTTTVPDTGPAANLEVTGSGSTSKPYVYIRAGGWGCASFTPASLAVVQSGQSRTLNKVAANTNKCRADAASDDVDANGQPDNTQLLYDARNGDSTMGENPSRIYLYRNFYASEVQLGISDYTPTGTAADTIAALPLISTIGNTPNHPTFGRALEPIQDWNLLSISKSGEYIPAFNKLVILTDSAGKPLPTVLTKKQNGQCIAYQPSDTGVIKFNQQNVLTKLTSLPAGVNCE